jgi:hypothetical protein
VIGDVVASRAADQRQLLATLKGALGIANDRVDAVQPLQLTPGDAFQGAYLGLSDALAATLLVRLHLRAAAHELRVGVGYGAITVHDPELEPSGQSGPAWWSARQAIDAAQALGAPHQRGTSGWLRTRFAGAGPAHDALVNALLACRDQLLAQLDEKDAAIAVGALLGRTQEAIGAEIGLAQSTVSERRRRHGIDAILFAHAELEELGPWPASPSSS